jgi:hypothetical protein
VLLVPDDVVVVDDGTVTIRVVVCSTVVVVLVDVVVVVVVDVDGEVVDVEVEVDVDVLVVRAAAPVPPASVPASSAPAAKRTAKPESFSAFGTAASCLQTRRAATRSPTPGPKPVRRRQYDAASLTEGRVMMYASAPISGRKMSSTVQPAFAQPEWSVRRKLSTRMKSRKTTQITQAKKMNIVHMMFRNG